MISKMISKEHNLGLSIYIPFVSLNILICYPFEYLPTPPMSTGGVVGGVGSNDADGPGAGAAPPNPGGPDSGTGSAGPKTGGGMKTSCLPP
jgi:hypothetical protein